MVDVRLDQSEPNLGDSQLPFVRYDNQRGSRDSMSDDEFATHPPDDILVEMPRDESPPPFQKFHRPPRDQSPSLPFAHGSKENSPFLPQEAHRSRPEAPQQAAIPQQVNNPVLQVEAPQHDKVWGSLYILSMSIMFTTSFIVWLHTEEINIPKKDTIYKALHGSYHLLAISTIVSIGFSMLWMYLLKSFVRPITYLILVGAPISLVSFSIYPFVMSFKAPEGGGSYGGQAAVMRWGSIAPMIGALYWVYCAWRNRFSMSRATGIIQLSCRIIGDNPALIVLSFSTLIGTVAFSWIWLAMFTRVFLTGNFIVGGQWWWSLNTKTISLGVYYIMMYLWTLGIFSGIHRATSAATVSQWYFHRHTLPKTSSLSIVSAALSHSTVTLFGPIALHSLMSLLVRLPILIAPPRLASLLHLFCFQFITSPIASLIDPLTLTFSAVHSIPLLSASRGVSQLRCVDTAGFGPQSHPRPAYRLAKMLLTSARAIAALGMGMAAWVAAARQVNGGSVYGYLVGLMAGSIGWAVIGATEGCLSNVVDATLVCVASEGDRGFCREARAAFGG
ncbi:hypothetical protein BZA77DRAFT_332413 [Pyronema omphalodes]|nr:hypothetical protein BZA77DRAFT_332413 [Pyronema omphalodes]